MDRYLYHFFPRRFESIEKTVSTVESIFRNGLLLSEETLTVDWADLYAVNGSQRDLSAAQFRFCLTAISNRNELRNHAASFGLIGLEFEEDFILKIGGFPVFYVPTPRNANAGIEEYTGVSLLYRLADVQEILERVIDRNLLNAPDMDLENVLGAVKFLSGICYPTQRKLTAESTRRVSYHNQREWRLLFNLTPEIVTTGYFNGNYTIQAFDNIPIRNFITRILIFEMQHISAETTEMIFKQIQGLLNHFGLRCSLEFIPLEEKAT